MMETLPANVQPYRRTPTFDTASVPPGLLRDHATRRGTWGLLHVASGSLMYCITEPGYEEEIPLTPSERGVIAPEQRHHVRFDVPATFYVEFFK
ncbi:MAG: DUF1971 domain-containing protein [Pseudomonadota bacterium]